MEINDRESKQYVDARPLYTPRYVIISGENQGTTDRLDAMRCEAAGQLGTDPGKLTVFDLWPRPVGTRQSVVFLQGAVLKPSPSASCSREMLR